jgi:hypothetical protein
LLLVFGLAKVFSGYPAGIALMPGVYYVVAVAEIACAGGLLTPAWRLVALVVVCGVAIGVIWTIMSTDDRPCGCLGSIIVLDKYDRLVTLSTLGIAATWALRRAGGNLPRIERD